MYHKLSVELCEQLFPLQNRRMYVWEVEMKYILVDGRFSAADNLSDRYALIGFHSSFN